MKYGNLGWSIQFVLEQLLDIIIKIMRGNLGAQLI